ncbi:PTS system trehalose-specific EIIBC component [Streptococcus gordonii]|jgi:PTS system trehalose-specific IIBC component|uniref:PTS system sucrose-specific EIIBCA component n=2 Tax=Streptococcus gordonii TaxID=1302 RepID=A0AB35FV66_STRGN|nr:MULTISPECIES: PTS system trehalose-specific EIIBC component [Streptococcus]MBZ2128317.1 PTS system trehalose-specific EIIBC component [Streptococcus gordonii]MBZ2130355.1 PTS system trehalose-specific EIIBC component [Streptococcus gordonii]MBZ2140623.1 PTS system trehalose-specific EIIBC component [Streptococcus gordonii]OFL22514.1 PTS beta-glucoside transporter subunit EIIBCA [Streptococcus sp. HMSC062B01]RSJ42768.1 PTS system trehalose-specific EIIBC component [Streptococcus gordonii]
MGKFEKEAKVLLDAIGGKENVSAVTHCATRMRFVLIDEKKADVKAIEEIGAVKGTFTNAGQFQVIIGNDVPIFYNDFTAVSGIEGVSKEAAKAAAKINQNAVQRVMTMLAEIFTPIIPAIIVGGLILGFRNILEGVQIQAFGQKVVDGVLQFTKDGEPIYKTIVDVSKFWAGVNHFLWLPGEAIFQFLPVGIVWSVSRKMGTSQILGIVLGICLVSPQLLNAYLVAGTPQSEIAKNWVWDFGFFTVQRIGYQAQVIPALLAGLSLSYLEIFWRKRIPEVVSMIFVPFLSLLPAIILAHTVLGPIGWTLGQWLSTIVLAGLTGPVKWLFGAVFGALYAPFVITGLHHMTNAIDSQLVADAGGTGLWPMIALSNIAQGSAVFAYYWMNRHNEKEAQIALPATISAYLGVTEPALFGVNVKYIYPFVAGMMGSSIAGLLSVSFNVKANAIGVGGLPGILSIQPKYMLAFAAIMLVAIAVPFVLTMLFRRLGLFTKVEDEAVKTPQAEALSEAKKSAPLADLVEIASPLSGQVKELSQATDPVFAQGVMGQGVLIEPSQGDLLAPVDGVVSVLFPTKHAVGIVSDQGVEMLMHIGMDTVNLEGKGFTAHVSQGDRVKVGDKLISFDIDVIKDAGYVTETPVIITNQDQYQADALGSLPRQIAVGDALMTATKI